VPRRLSSSNGSGSFDWYAGMISERTGRLVYTYEPERDVAVVDGSAIRDIASVWDVALVSRFLGRSELRPLVERSLRHFIGWLVPRDGALILDPVRLGEPSGIAHSAFLLLALLEADLPGAEAEIDGLAEGLRRQQRTDGSYRISFGDEEDEGLEFYPGEAMLALMHDHARGHDPSDLASVERGFSYCSRRLPADAVAADLLVFYANWQSQYAALLHAETAGDALRNAVRDHVFALHDRILANRFYEGIERHPARQATVEVACALEGLNDAFAIAAREGDDARLGAYAGGIRIALRWLLRAQRLDGGTARERGGFGHTLTERTQRIDVTGHVAAGFMKSATNGLGG
jgi:hypothetical protein